MKEFRQIQLDKETFDKISELARILGKKKAQTVREIFEALFDKVEGLENANLKILRHPMRRTVIFEFYGRQKLYLEQKILTIKRVKPQ